MKPRAKVVYTFLATMCCATMLAIPAKRGQWKTITLSDGRQVKVELRGDERAHWWEDSLCQRYVLRGETRGVWSEECGVRNDDETRGVRIDDEIWEKMEEKDWSKMLKTRRYSHSTLHTPHSTIHTPHSTTPVPIKGSGVSPLHRGLIILVEFPNQRFREENDLLLFSRIANEQGFSERGFKGSVSDYFHDQSNGLLQLTFDVVGPVLVSNDYEYYGKNVPPDDYDAHPDEMVVEACQHVDEEVNFADYDWDGDGYVEQVVVIYAGQGEANGGGKTTIWPHEWELTESDYGKYLQLDKVRISTYACSSELSSPTRIDGIGTICHEFSHCLGLPDMYDEDQRNYGMGYWDIMDNGCYNGNGFQPAGFTAYEKMYCGWLEPTVLSRDTLISGVEPLSEGGEAFIIYNDAHPDEFFMLENRQMTSWDKSLPGSGLLVYHVDYNADAWFWNVVNSYTTYYDIYNKEYKNDHERCSVVQADNNKSKLPKGLAGDTYPYQLNDSLTAFSKPATTLFHEDLQGNQKLQVAVMNIRKNGNKTISFDFFQRAGEPSGIVLTRKEDALPTAIYSLQGVFLGNNLNNLPKGIYLIDGKKVIKK
jgi:M6 family metalloprotease-like protein